MSPYITIKEGGGFSSRIWVGPNNPITQPAENFYELETNVFIPTQQNPDNVQVTARRTARTYEASPTVTTNYSWSEENGGDDYVSVDDKTTDQDEYQGFQEAGGSGPGGAENAGESTETPDRFVGVGFAPATGDFENFYNIFPVPDQSKVVPRQSTIIAAALAIGLVFATR